MVKTLTRRRADIDGRVGNGAWQAKPTRRGFLRAVAAGTAWIALGGTLGCEPSERTRASASKAPPEQAWGFRSRPDLRLPNIRVTTLARGVAPGYVFCAPKNGPDGAGPGQDGCLILDNTGQPVWFRPVGTKAMDVMDFKLQEYGGRSVLRWWEGEHTGYGQGEYVLMDASYREVTRVRTGNGLQGDHHEFLISPEDTALFTIYHRVPMDLSVMGGEVDSTVLDGIVQKVDIETGEVLFEWHSLEHVGIDEPYSEPPENPEFAHDYFHLNFIEVDHNGNLIVSARRTSAVYKIDRESGEVIWRLGGKKSDFEMGPVTRTDWQHHARRQPDGTITIFDNGGVSKDEQSRAIVIKLEEEARTATLVREYTHRTRCSPLRRAACRPRRTATCSSAGVASRTCSSSTPRASFSSTPTSRSKASLTGLSAFRGQDVRGASRPWPSRPGEEEATLYVSCNGATKVAEWEVLVGPDPESLKPLGLAPRKGFETAVTTKTNEAYVGLRAKDGSGKTLGTARARRVGTS